MKNINPNQKESKSQLMKIKDHLLSGKSLTSLDALYAFGCFRLGARINDLKKQGMNISSELIEITSGGKTKRVAKYKLVK
jgi:hypothetical protein